MTLGIDLPFLPLDLVTTPRIQGDGSHPVVCRVIQVKDDRYVLQPLESRREKCGPVAADQLTLVMHGSIWNSVHPSQVATR